MTAMQARVRSGMHHENTESDEETFQNLPNRMTSSLILQKTTKSRGASERLIAKQKRGGRLSTDRHTRASSEGCPDDFSLPSDSSDEATKSIPEQKTSAIKFNRAFR